MILMEMPWIESSLGRIPVVRSDVERFDGKPAMPRELRDQTWSERRRLWQ